MKRLIVISLVVLSLAFAGCSGVKKSGKQVLCGNSIVLSLVKDCGGGIEASSLIPPETCPGSFDLRPEDAAKINAASVFIIQPFQQPLADKAVKINTKLAVEVVKTNDMTIPENYFSGLVETAAALEKYFPEKGGDFINNYNSIIGAIRESVIKDTDLIQSIRSKHIGVIVSSFQEATARYLGFDVVTVFNGPEQLKPSDINKILAAAKASSAALIISNLTGTHDKTADILNKTLKIRKAVLISFPGETKNGSMFLNLWSYNTAQIRTALGQ
jgi:ABC-type Zn uptake system ZnuABC Zn-binding protein ZnuA